MSELFDDNNDKYDEDGNGFTAQLAVDIEGVHTEFVFQHFANRWFVMITQYGRLPNLYTVQFDVKRDDALPSIIQGPIDDPEFHVSVPLTIKCNFGGDTDTVRGGIQFLVNKTKLKRCPTELLMGLGLKETDGKTLRSVANVLDEWILP